MIDYSTQTDECVRNLLLESSHICVTPKLKELLTINKVLKDLIGKMNDNDLIDEFQQLQFDIERQLLTEEVCNNIEFNL
ncbi:hypothetical protein N9M53_03360 [Alphaproteobacteria bacterium]|nr:hypothetical protein [Alphaproteobacteria bacterium]